MLLTGVFATFAWLLFSPLPEVRSNQTFLFGACSAMGLNEWRVMGVLSVSILIVFSGMLAVRLNTTKSVG